MLTDSRIVAISGLGGHAFGSFKQRGGDHMWLRDSLPGDITTQDKERPIARVMTYGYESTVTKSDNFQNIEDLAIGFYTTLLALVDNQTARPILLIAHSLGGLIVKQVRPSYVSPWSSFNAYSRL